MKIGILTHQYINNFGAFLQAYALQEAIKELCPNDEIYIINYINIKHFVINYIGWFRFYSRKETFKSWRDKAGVCHTFSSERKKHLSLTRKCFTTKSVNNLGLDCIVIGSDEVWNFNDKKSFKEMKFGYGLTSKNIISYAPSVGKSSVKDKLPENIIDGLKNFKCFSARDELTEEFIKVTMKKDATRVLDPTFLHSFPIENTQKIKKPYILFYYCDNLTQEYMDQIINYAKVQDYDIYGAGEFNKVYNDITINITPFEWVNMFRNAELVFTGTFHGAVFSILNKKNFYCYLTNESRIKKVTALLKQLHIDDRVISGKVNIDKLMENKINYENVYINIEKNKNISVEYLKNSIKQGVNDEHDRSQ